MTYENPLFAVSDKPALGDVADDYPDLRRNANPRLFPGRQSAAGQAAALQLWDLRLAADVCAYFSSHPSRHAAGHAAAAALATCRFACGSCILYLLFLSLPVLGVLTLEFGGREW